MYYAFQSEFMNQWNHPEEVEKHRKESEKKKYNERTRINMESLEKCIKKNSIDELDRTKPYDKTFICDGFISYTSDVYMNNSAKHNEEMKHFTEDIKSEVKKLDINYTENPKVLINKVSTNTEYLFDSNFISKNTFTNISSFLVFRISNTKHEENPEIIKHLVSNF
jgi:hypothetical protein